MPISIYTIHAINTIPVPISIPIHHRLLLSLLLLLPLDRKPPQNPQLHPPQRTQLSRLQIHPRHRPSAHPTRLKRPERLEPASRAETPLTPTRDHPAAATTQIIPLGGAKVEEFVADDAGDGVVAAIEW